jgi:predicted HicB family RNase H-like nuclease
MPKSGDALPPQKRGRLIHVRLDADTHRRLRVATAEQDVTIQDWVATLIERELERLQAPRDRKGGR